MTQTRRSRLLWLAGLVAALILAGVVSFYASSEPDGLERVAEDQGIAEQAAEHPSTGSPLADYQAGGVEDSRLSGALAGVIGVGVVLVLGSGVTWAVRRRGADDPQPAGISSDRSHGG